jgi:hypothetical protein
MHYAQASDRSDYVTYMLTVIIGVFTTVIKNNSVY